MGSSDESGSSSSSSEAEKKVTKKAVKKVTKKEPKVAKGKGKKEGKKEKKKKDENAPRRYLSPFIFFSKDHRPMIKAQHPQSTFGEIGSLLGREWGKITPEDKKKYEKMAAEDKKRWELEKKLYDEKSKQAPAESSSDSSDESD